MSAIVNPSGGSGVTSVFTRTGAVVAQDNDYFLVGRKMTGFFYNGALAAPSVVAEFATVTGTTSVIAPTATAGASTQYANSATSTVQGLAGATGYRTGRNISYQALVTPVRITDERIWIVLSDQAIATAGGSDAPAGNYAGFRFSTQASDSVWQCITQDGVTQNVQSSGVAPVAGTMQTFDMIFNDSIPNIQFYINRTLVATATTHLPTTATNIKSSTSTECFSASAGSGIQIGQIMIHIDI